jgi:hypothetical protein
MYAYIAWDLFTNLETFSTLIDFQKKCYGKYTTKAVFVAGLYMLSITPNFSRASYSRCSFFFHTIYRMIYFSWNNFIWVHMFSKYVKFWKYRVDLLMKLRFLKSFIEIVQKIIHVYLICFLISYLRYTTVTRWEYTSVFYSNHRHCHSKNC